MKKMIFVILKIFLLTNLNAQSKNNWSIGIHLNPFLSVPIFDDFDRGESEPILNHKFGLDLYLSLTENLEFKTGIKYRYLEFRQILDVIIPPLSCPIDQTLVNVDETYAVRYDEEFAVHYIGIPIEMKYFFSADHENLYTKIGFEILALVKDEIWLSEIFASHDCTPDHALELNRLIYNLNLGIGNEFSLSKKIKLVIEPNIGVTINKIFKNPNKSQDAVTAGINNNIRILDLGLMIGLKF